MLSHAAVEFAVQAHSRAVLTPSVPLPPDAGTLSSAVLTVTPHRGTFAGAVEVEDEEPQPAAVAAATIARSDASARVVMVGIAGKERYELPSGAYKPDKKGTAAASSSIYPTLPAFTRS